MSFAPLYYASMRQEQIQIATANTLRDGTGTIADLVVGNAAPGSRVLRVDCKATGTTTAGMLRLFIHDGTVWRLHRELDVTAITPSGTVKAWTGSVDLRLDTDLNVVLQTTGTCRKLGVSTHNAETFNVTAMVGDY